MVNLTILYKNPSDPAKFDAHYFATHMPLAAKLPGLVRAGSIKIGGGLDGSDAPYYAQTDLVFESREAMLATFGSPEGQALTADMANFENEGMVMYLGEILFSAP
jgi:uncharacterized protein (TIGR02118 family)